MDNIQTELEECTTGTGNAQIDGRYIPDNYISDNKTKWNLLPNKIWLKIIRAVLSSAISKQITFHICNFEPHKQKI